MLQCVVWGNNVIFTTDPRWYNTHLVLVLSLVFLFFTSSLTLIFVCMHACMCMCVHMHVYVRVCLSSKDGGTYDLLHFYFDL